MGIEAVARGSVAGAPVKVTTDNGSATVLVVRSDAKQRIHYEVTCRDPRLGEVVRDRVRIGDRLVVIGRLDLHAVAEPVEDPGFVARINIEAFTIALDLGAPIRDYS